MFPHPYLYGQTGRPFRASNSPPELGGVAALLRKSREASLAAQTGWFQRRSVSALPLNYGFRREEPPRRFAPPLLT